MFLDTVDVNFGMGCAIRVASDNNHINIIKFLLINGADIKNDKWVYSTLKRNKNSQIIKLIEKYK